MYVMYVIPHISNRILNSFWELPSTHQQLLTGTQLNFKAQLATHYNETKEEEKRPLFQAEATLAKSCR